MLSVPNPGAPIAGGAGKVNIWDINKIVMCPTLRICIHTVSMFTCSICGRMGWSILINGLTHYVLICLGGAQGDESNGVG